MTSDPSAAPRAADVPRQVVVTLGLLACLVGALVASGTVGGLAAPAGDDSLLSTSPLGLVLGIAGYAGLTAYTVRQWLPAEAREPRQRAIGWLAAGAMLLDGLWLVAVRLGWTLAAATAVAGLVWTLGGVVARLERHPSYGFTESSVVDGTFGAHLGWACALAVSSVTAALREAGLDPRRPLADVASVVVLALAALLGAVLVHRLGGRWALGAGMAWGLAAIAVDRFAGQPRGSAVGLAALAAAAAILVATARWHTALSAHE